MNNIKKGSLVKVSDGTECIVRSNPVNGKVKITALDAWNSYKRFPDSDAIRREMEAFTDWYSIEDLQMENKKSMKTISEAQLRKIIAEAIESKVIERNTKKLNESFSYDDDETYGNEYGYDARRGYYRNNDMSDNYDEPLHAWGDHMVMNYDPNFHRPLNKQEQQRFALRKKAITPQMEKIKQAWEKQSQERDKMPQNYNESKNRKSVTKITESHLKAIVAESIRKVTEGRDDLYDYTDFQSAPKEKSESEIRRMELMNDLYRVQWGKIGTGDPTIKKAAYQVAQKWGLTPKECSRIFFGTQYNTHDETLQQLIDKACHNRSHSLWGDGSFHNDPMGWLDKFAGSPEAKDMARKLRADNSAQSTKLGESLIRKIVAESIKNVLENSYRDAAKKGDKTSNANKHTLNGLKKRYDKDAPKKFHKFANKYGLDKTTKNASAVSNWEDDCNDSGTPVSKLKESQLRKVVAESVRKVLKESDFSPFSDEDDFATTNDTRISTPTNRFRVKYFFKKENPNARPNRFGNIPPEEKYINDTEIEEFDNIDEAEKFFNKLCNTWEEGNLSPIWVLDVTLERLKDTLVGKYWDNIRSASYNAWRNETR